MELHESRNLTHLQPKICVSTFLKFPPSPLLGFADGTVVKNLSASEGKRCGFNPWVRKIPWRRNWQPTPLFLPGKSHGQRCQYKRCGFNPWSEKIPHAKEQLSPCATSIKPVLQRPGNTTTEVCPPKSQRSATSEATTMRSPRTTTREQCLLTETRETAMQQQRPRTAKK